jgi:TPP-dependent pyruvate/acetoin dehydrogenase alpha subunit
MLAIRRLEEASAKAYSNGKIGGFLHLIIGQEAVCVGAIAALEHKDYVVATYREHGHAYAKGVAARPIMAELYGKKTGLVKGLGGSMHLFDKATNVLGGYGIVGGHVPIAAGAAFASKYRGDGCQDTLPLAQNHLGGTLSAASANQLPGSRGGQASNSNEGNRPQGSGISVTSADKWGRQP